MKDDYIRFNINRYLKNDFLKVCDGRTMTSVLEKLIKQYIIENRKTGFISDYEKFNNVKLGNE